MLLYAYTHPSDKYVPMLGASVSYKLLWRLQRDLTKIEL